MIKKHSWFFYTFFENNFVLEIRTGFILTALSFLKLKSGKQDFSHFSNGTWH